MPLGTLARPPPPFLMAADTKFRASQPLRAGVATVLYPLQWLALRPVLAGRWVGGYFESLKTAQANEEQARVKLALQSQRANQVDELLGEIRRLRGLLALRERLTVASQAQSHIHI